MTNLFKHLEDLMAKGLDPVAAENQTEVWDRYGKTVSVMILDSSGFSRVSEQHGILHFLSRLVQMRKIVSPVLEQHNVQDYKFEADNLYAVFTHPDDAIRSAMAMHLAVKENKLMLTDDEPFKVCIGIGYGKLLYSETLEGFFGEEMNLASKLGEDTADGGETLLTQAAFQHSDPALIAEFEQKTLDMAGLHAPYYQHQSQ